MATNPTPSPPPLETESAAFCKVAALLLGFAVAAIGILALLMWADARESWLPRARSGVGG